MRLPDDILECVVFLCVKTTKNMNVVDFESIGTAYFVSVSSDAPNMLYGYIVTAKHCVEGVAKHGDLWVRMNARGGPAKYIKLDNPSWKFSSDPSVDLAVLPFAPPLNEWEYKLIDHTMLVNQAKIAEHSIGIGEEAVISGLFFNMVGKERISPIVRFGNVSAMPTEKIAGDTPDSDFHAYLVEVRSIGGLSGSPVFIYLGPTRVLNNTMDLGHSYLLLLGTIRGHWHYVLPKGQATAMSDDLKNVNMGIAVVTPASELESILMGAELTQARRTKDEEVRRETAASISMDSANLIKKE